MRVGVPTEIKADEYRVALTPAGVRELVDAGHDVLVQEVAFVTGRFDYHVRVACRDADDLDATVRAIRGEAGAAQTETRIVLRVSAAPKAVS